MKIIEYKSKDRGYANYGWLQANYSFSFANYYNPNKENFGALRVLNDDVIQGGMGFGEHPHKNMEIITIPLQGTLKHKDNMSEKWIVLKSGEVQVMSAGTGIMHSEKNNSGSEYLNLFQIWIFPKTNNLSPNYNQMKFEESQRKNKLQILVSPVDSKIENTLKINQDAVISRIDLDKNKKNLVFSFKIRKGGYATIVMREFQCTRKKS